MKSGQYPWEKSDKKTHQFVYSMMCHDQALADSEVFDEVQRLNTPMWAVITDKKAGPDNCNYLSIENAPNCQMTAFKRSEKDPKAYVIRLAELRGTESMARVQF